MLYNLLSKYVCAPGAQVGCVPFQQRYLNFPADFVVDCRVFINFIESARPAVCKVFVKYLFLSEGPHGHRTNTHSLPFIYTDLEARLLEHRLSAF